MGLGSEGSWNPSFEGYSQFVQAACAVAGTFAGKSTTFPTYPNTIVSVSRDGAGTATAVITGAPHNQVVGTSKLYVAGITNITGGYVTLTACVNNGDGTWSVSWAEAGAAVTGTIATSGSRNFSSYIHTDVESGAAHYLVKATVSYGTQAANTFVTPAVMKGRWVVERFKTINTLLQSLATQGRFKLVMNNQVGGATGNGCSENEAYPYALDRWGDHSFIYTICSAPYFGSDTAVQSATSAQNVIDLMKSTGGIAVDAFAALFIKEGNAKASWNKPCMFYEGGQGQTHIGSAGAFIGQANRDITLSPSLFDLQTTMLQMQRDLAGQVGPFCYFCSGSRQQFGSADNSMWYLHEAGVITDMTGPKPAALKSWLAQPAQAMPVDGMTSGTINIATVYSAYYGSSSPVNGCFIINLGYAVIDVGLQVNKTVAGNYPIGVYACSSNASDWVTILVNGVEVAHQTPLTLQNPTVAAPTTPVWSSAAYPMNAGRNVVTLRVKPTSRSGVVGLLQIVSPDTPV